MNELQIFNSPEFGQVRTIKHGDTVLFCANDVAVALSYKKPNNAINRHCKHATLFQGIITDSLGRKQDANFIPYGDVVRLATRSELPNADIFEGWIFDEVIPSVMKHGGYLTPAKIEEVLSNPDTIIKLATELKQERAKRIEHEQKIEADKPKVLFAEAVETAKSSILVGELAKLIKQNGIDIGQQRLFNFMRENGYLIKQKGSAYNMPTQKSMNLGLFEIKERTINHSDHVEIVKTPKVTGKGQIYFINMFAKNKMTA
jgi:phage antirepressor YoqD-like protein